MRALGIDIGGTKIAAAVVDSAGVVIARHLVATPSSGDGDVVLAAVCAAGDGALAAAGYAVGSAGYDEPRGGGAAPDARGTAASGLGGAEPLLGGAEPLAGVGVATAGPIDAESGSVSPVNIGAWRGYPLRDRLAAHYGPWPIRLFGDGIAIAIAEHWLGAGRGADNMLGMVVSTGVGGGLVLGGRVLFGRGGNAGHIGHLSIDATGPLCPCGGIGCLETFASGTAIAAWYAAECGDGVARSAAEVAGLARAGDGLAVAAFRRSAEALGRALAGTVTLLDLDRVVIGGGVAHAWDLLAEPLQAAYRRFAALDFAAGPVAGRPRMVRAELAGDTGVLGAAAVILHPDRYWPGRAPSE